MEYEKCYVFEPEDPRPTKIRRIESRGLQASWKIRQRAYERAWQEQKGMVDVRI
jgi:origin recognition complex subunit 3